MRISHVQTYRFLKESSPAFPQLPDPTTLTFAFITYGDAILGDDNLRTKNKRWKNAGRLVAHDILTEA